VKFALVVRLKGEGEGTNLNVHGGSFMHIEGEGTNLCVHGVEVIFLSLIPLELLVCRKLTRTRNKAALFLSQTSATPLRPKLNSS
jgi:hypothetical protein